MAIVKLRIQAGFEFLKLVLNVYLHLRKGSMNDH